MLGLAVWIGLSVLVSALVPVPRLAAQSAETSGSVAAVPGSRAVRAHTSPPIVATEVTDLTVTRTRTSTDEFEVFVDTLIGSLQFGSFGIGQALGDPAMGGLLLPLDLPTPFSIGEPAGTNPSEGLLFWSGSAFARDVSGTETNGHVVIGEVEVSIASYADPRANVSFFDLFDLNTGASREGFGWTDVPVQDGTFNAGSLWRSQASDPATGVPVQDGAFGAGTQSEAVQGKFFGQSHIGVGGIFQSDGLIGAFGAQRAHPEALTVVDARPVLPSGPLPAATRLLGVVLGGPPTLHEPMVGGSSEFDSPLTEAPVPLGDIQGEINIGQMSLSLRGIAGGTSGDHGELSMTVRFGLGLGDLLPATLSMRADGLAGQDGQAGYSVLTSEIEFDLGQGPQPFPEGVEATTLIAGGFGFLTSPTASVARWTGRLQAEDISDSRWQGNQVSGDVSISVHLAPEPAVNVEFTNLADQGSTRTHENISWTSIPVSKGNFVAEDGANLLQGVFAGLDGTSVAGIFQWNGLSGGFVASDMSRAVPLLPIGQSSPDAVGEDVRLHVSVPSLDARRGIVGTVAEVSTIEGLLLNARPEDPVGLIQGVRIDRLELADTQIGGVASDVNGLGGWLDEGYFGAAGIYRTDEDLVQRRWASAALMVGTGSSSNPPDVSATWTGEMVGIDTSGSETDGNLVRGDASISLRTATYLLATVSLTGIVDQTSDLTRPDMWWGGIPVFNGSFESATSDDEIAGRFLGPDHHEVAGTFDWSGIQGAFGARIADP
ncbi:MAG: hypothetical protein OXH83_08115 [Bryobacterales bacterium]|nr:hypothetical protein [Bryobacterales bacterium]